MSEQREQAAVGEDCQERLAEIRARQEEFDGLWLKMSGGDTSRAARYRELRRILDELRADYHRTCGDLKESSSLPPSVLADWH